MKRSYLFVAALLVAAQAAPLLASGGEGEKPATAGGQPKPVVFFSSNPYTATDEDMARVEAWYEQQTGVQITTRYVKDPDDFGTQLTTALAAQEDIDVVRNSGTVAMADWKARGIAQDITDSVNKFGPNMKKNMSAEVWKSVTIGGRIWAYPDEYENNTGVVISIRKDWRTKLGLGPVTTIQEFETYLKKVRDADFDKNGKADTIPLMPYWGMEGAEWTVLYAYTGAPGAHKEGFQASYIDSKGNVTPTVLHPGFKTYLSDMARWYKEGLIYRETMTVSGSQQNDLIAANLVGSTATWYSDFFTGWASLVATVPDADYEIILLKGPDGVARFPSTPGGPGWQVVSWSKVADWATKMMDWSIASPENYLSQYHGQIGVDWQFVDRAKSTRSITKTDPKKTFHSFMVNYKMNGQPLAQGDWRRERYINANTFLASQKAYFAPDWYVPYDFKGTSIERANADAATLVNEAIANIVLGRRPVSDWDGVAAEYRRMYADEFIKLATEQFKAFK